MIAIMPCSLCGQPTRLPEPQSLPVRHIECHGAFMAAPGERPISWLARMRINKSMGLRTIRMRRDGTIVSVQASKLTLKWRDGLMVVSFSKTDWATVREHVDRFVALDLDVVRLATSPPSARAFISAHLVKLHPVRDVGDDPLSKIFGAMKGVFSGPEADAYFGGLDGDES